MPDETREQFAAKGRFDQRVSVDIRRPIDKLLVAQTSESPTAQTVELSPSIGISKEGMHMSVSEDTPTSIYRYYDKFDLLIYVGITSRGIVRNKEHNATKEWWPHVVRQEVEHHPTRREALIQERGLIEKFRPPFNKVHNPYHSELREAYLKITARGDSPYTASEIFRHHKGTLWLKPGEFDPRYNTRQFLTRVEDYPLAALVYYRGGLKAVGGKKLASIASVRREGMRVAVLCQGRWLNEVKAATLYINREKKGFEVRSLVLHKKVPAHSLDAEWGDR